MVVTICPEGFYCPSGTAVPHQCEGNGTCPEGSSSPTAAIKNCDAGFYQDIDTCSPCMAGFVCNAGCKTKYPISETKENGYECPAGHYCPAGTTK